MTEINWPAWIRSWPCIDNNCDGKGTVCVGVHNHGDGDLEPEIHQCQFCTERELLAKHVERQGCKLGAVEKARDDAQQLADREFAIVARIWGLFGNPSCDDLKGRSIYDLIQETLDANAEKALRLDTIVAMVAVQALDEGLWFFAETAPEAYLQQELRALHAAIEGVSPEECAAR